MTFYTLSTTTASRGSPLRLLLLGDPAVAPTYYKETLAMSPIEASPIGLSPTLQCRHPKRKDVSTSEALLSLILRLAVELNRRA